MGLALIAVIALSVVGTVLVLRPESNSNAGDGDNGGGNPPTSATSQNGKSEFASANDTGPVNIIAEDPTCEAWGKVSGEIADVANSVNWQGRDASIPSNAWTPEQRTMYETVSEATAGAADKTEKLARLTPHRVMRELYEQYVVYARAFVQTIPTYSARDENAGVTVDTLGTALSNICTAEMHGTSARILPFVSTPPPPTKVLAPNNESLPEKMLERGNPICAAWSESSQKFTDATSAWTALNPDIPAKEWTPEERSINESAASVMASNADELQQFGQQSGSPVIEDIAILAAQYRRAFVAAVPNYTPVDNQLANAAAELVKVIIWACKASA